MASFYNTSGAQGNNYGGNSGATGFGNPGTTSSNFGGNSGNTGGQHQSQQNTGYPASNVQQWQAQAQPQAQTQTQPYGQSAPQQSHQQQQQQGANATPFWSPNTQQAASQMATQAAMGFMTGNMSGETVLNKGMNEIQKAFGGGVPGLNYIVNTLRSYFAVDNRYVKRKMLKVLFPFTNKEWKREQIDGNEMVNYAPPHLDENAPDLYLPTMSLITYCLLSAFLYGTAGQFNPEVIADVITECFVAQIIEVLVIKGCLSMMAAPIPFLDIFSYTGYKYLGLTISMLCGIVFKHLEWGTASYYGAFLWTASAAAWFMLKTMANNIPMETAATGPKRDIMVLVFAGSQVATMWFVGQTKYL